MTIQVSSTPDSTCYYRTTVLHEIMSYYLLYFWESPRKVLDVIANQSILPRNLCHPYLIRALEVPSPGLWLWREKITLALLP